MATPGLQIAVPSGAPAAWGTGTSSRNFQRFTGTTSAASSTLDGGKWYTVRNEGTVVVYLRWGDSKGTTPVADNTNVAIQLGEMFHWVAQAGTSDIVAAFAAASGADLKLWQSEGSA